MFNFIKKIFKKNKSEEIKKQSENSESNKNIKSDNLSEEKKTSKNEKEENNVLSAEANKEKEKVKEEIKEPVPATKEAAETTETALEDSGEIKNSPYGKFCVKLAADGTYMFNLKASNGSIIATSQTYTSKSSCMNGIQSIRNNAPEAAVEDQTVDEIGSCPHPKFEIYVDKGGSYRFRLKATNGNIIAASQGYSSKSKCKNGVDSVKRHAALATVIEEQ